MVFVISRSKISIFVQTVIAVPLGAAVYIVLNILCRNEIAMLAVDILKGKMIRRENES